MFIRNPFQHVIVGLPRFGAPSELPSEPAYLATARNMTMRNSKAKSGASSSAGQPYKTTITSMTDFVVGSLESLCHAVLIYN